MSEYESFLVSPLIFKEEKRMKNFKMTMTILTIAILTIPMTASFSIPTVNAHTPPLQIPTYAFISATPNPAGLVKQLLSVFGSKYRHQQHKHSLVIDGEITQ